MWSNRYVRTIILSRVLLQLGVWVRNFAILLYVTDVTGDDPLYVSLISVAEFAPIFLFAIIGGTFADRWKPRRTMIASDWLSSVSIFVVLIVVANGSWHALFFATLASSILSQFSQPSAMKLFKQHVPEEQLQGVMAMFQTLMAFFMVIGPIVGAFVYSQYGIEVSLASMGILFIGSGIILMTLPRDPEKKEASKAAGSFMRQMSEGFGYVYSSPVLRKLGGTFVAAGLAVGLIQPLLLFVTIENLGQDKSFLQWLLMSNGAAMLIGGAVVMGIAKKVKPQMLLAIGLLVSTVGTFGIGWSTSIPVTIGLQALNGLCYPLIPIGINTILMRNTPGEFIGRVGGVLTPMFMGMMVVGMTASGVLKESLSLFAVYSLASVLFLTGAILIGKLRTGSVNATN